MESQETLCLEHENSSKTAQKTLLCSPKTQLDSNRHTSGFRAQINHQKAKEFAGFYEHYLETYWKGIFDDLKTCSSYGEIRACEYGHDNYMPFSCQRRKHCLICSSKVLSSLVGSYVDLTEILSDALETLYFIPFVFTFPRELWGILEHDPKTCFRLVKETLAEYYGYEPGVILKFHNWHSSKPLKNEFYPHVHGFGFNYVFDKSDQAFRMCDNYHNVDELRRLWKEKLESKFDISISGNVDLRFEYIKADVGNGWKIRHRLKYMFRTALVDIVDFCSVFDFPNESAGPSDIGWLDSLLRGKHGKDHQGYGWLSDGTKNRYLALIGCHHTTRGERGEKVCVCCGNPLVKLVNHHVALSELTTEYVNFKGNDH